MVSFIPYQNVYVRVFILTEIWLLWMCVLTGLISACCLFCVPSLARQVPNNYILMTLFTVCEAYTVAFSCAAVNSPMTVVMAASMTAGIVVALTLYAILAKTDFTVFGGIAFILGAAFIMFGLFGFLFGRTMELIYCLLGVCLFGFYLIIDTQLILEGKAYQLDYDDYILGAIILYLDILNIFLYLLRILTQTRESQ